LIDPGEMPDCIDFRLGVRYVRFMKIFLVGLAMALLINCSSHKEDGTASTTESGEPGVMTTSGDPKITLTAHPRQGFAPIHVSFSAKLSGVPDNSKDHYCLQEEWDFGDGAVSSQQPNCEPYTESSNIEREFFADHVFEDPGNFTVRFVLGDKNKLRSNQLTVVVLEGKPKMGR
jgi:hypothetical protein